VQCPGGGGRGRPGSGSGAWAYAGPGSAWPRGCHAVALPWLWDVLLFDHEAGRFTPERFCAESEREFGGFDGIVLWHAEGIYPVGGNLAGAVLSDACLNLANVAHAQLDQAHLNHATMAHANLWGASVQFAHLEGVDLSHSNMVGASLVGSNLDGKGTFPQGGEETPPPEAFLSPLGHFRIRCSCGHINQSFDRVAAWPLIPALHPRHAVELTLRLATLPSA